MPLWKYVANRFITLFENLLMGAKLSEYHTAIGPFPVNSSALPLDANSDDFVFDNQMLAQIVLAWLHDRRGQLSDKYFAEASSINFPRSLRYGFGCLGVAVQFRWLKCNSFM
jgi:hypothetical protein